MNMQSLKILRVIALLGAGCEAQQLQVNLATEASVESRLESGLVGTRQREQAIETLFTDAGCQLREEPVNKSTANVVCTFPGQTDSTILVGAHFDYVDRGRGIVDDWSGASLLPSLYEALKAQPRHHTYVFIAFAAEERGLVGSRKYVKDLTAEQKNSIHAFVNLECLGLGPPNVWVHRAAPHLLARLEEMAAKMKVDLQGVNVDNLGDDDSHPFFSAQIPVITIHSITQGTFRILHSPFDRLDAIHFDDYYATYKLLAFYLADLDAKTD
jgi:Zn-dependent M28 family amino/carboxypeptidase